MDNAVGLWSNLWRTECGQTDTHTSQKQTQTDKKLKTEGTKILSNDIFYPKTVIIGGPTIENYLCVQQNSNSEPLVLDAKHTTNEATEHVNIVVNHA